MVLVFSSLIYIFYKNRFELLVININADNIHLTFINNSFYKRKDINVERERIKLKQDGDILSFWIDGQQQAIVREKAVSKSDWDKLLNALMV